MLKFIFSTIITSIFFIFIMLFAVSFLTLWERKLLGGIQRRQGPVFTGILGLLQPFADGLKLLFKTFNMPTGAYYYVFIGSSVFSLVLSLLSWTILPFTKTFVLADVNCGLILILLISSLGKLTILFSGWSSNSKYGVLGSIRSGAQMASYEVPLLLSLFPIVLISSELNLTNIINIQANSIWFIFVLPSALIFFICSLAETNRPPFDLPEAESELVAGYNIEYSSLSFAVFFLAEYNHVITASALYVILFLGGWSMYPTNMPGARAVQHYTELKMVTIFIFKTILVVNLFIYVRAVLPRYKFTDLISMCWQVFIPGLLLNFFIIWHAYYLCAVFSQIDLVILGSVICLFVMLYWSIDIFAADGFLNNWYFGYFKETEEEKYAPLETVYWFEYDTEVFQAIYTYWFLWFTIWHFFVFKYFGPAIVFSYLIVVVWFLIMTIMGYFLFLKEK